MKSKLLLSLLFILIFILCGGQENQQTDVYIIDYQADEIDVDRLVSCLISKGWNNVPKIEGMDNTVQLIFDEPWDGEMYDSLADECEDEFKKDDEDKEVDESSEAVVKPKTEETLQDLDYYESIVPCGIEDYGITSMAQIMGDEVPSMVEIKLKVKNLFSKNFIGMKVNG